MEEVVLLNEHGEPCGTADKDTVHTTDTPLHLAFSCYLTDDDGRLLLTRRALSKATWPGVWTNSFCGHPAPGESVEDAIVRRARQELGCEITDLTCMLPDFHYRAEDASGIVENEICPVYEARLVGDITPDPAEVCEAGWVAPEALDVLLAEVPFLLSPWLVEQVPGLLVNRHFLPED